MHFNDPRTEWRISDIERGLRSKAEDYEVSTLRSQLDSLEHTVRQLSSLVDGLRNELETAQSQIREVVETNYQ